MSTPVVESITADIATAINEITTANNYNHDLTAVRPKRNDFSDVIPANGRVLIVQTGDEPADGQVNLADDQVQNYALMALVIQSDETETSVDTLRNQVKSDIRKKLAIDCTRGGLAIDTLFGPATPFDDGKLAGIAVEVAVHYRTAEGDPYTQG